jgi:hypothetical protein
MIQMNGSFGLQIKTEQGPMMGAVLQSFLLKGLFGFSEEKQHLRGGGKLPGAQAFKKIYRIRNVQVLLKHASYNQMQSE